MIKTFKRLSRQFVIHNVYAFYVHLLIHLFLMHEQGGKASGFRGHQQEVQDHGRPRLFQVRGNAPERKKALEVCRHNPADTPRRFNVYKTSRRSLCI